MFFNTFDKIIYNVSLSEKEKNEPNNDNDDNNNDNNNNNWIITNYYETKDLLSKEIVVLC